MRNRQQRSAEMAGGAYGLEVAVYDIHRMEVSQSAGRFCELQERFSVQELGEERRWGVLNEGG